MEITALSARHMYCQVLNALREHGVTSPSRNGTVLRMTEPVLVELRNPTDRVLYDADRKANPFFHVMETVWMLAGKNDIKWLKQFNSNIDSYADYGVIKGAYGHRWLYHFRLQQLELIAEELRRDSNSRQCVLAMWDPIMDLPPMEAKDRPCNTHIYFGVVNGKLDMTVCNRSNDAIWGMCGANVVHMTYLQELMALATEYPIGNYYVMSNNLHIYEHHWDLMAYCKAEGPSLRSFPIAGKGVDLHDFGMACQEFIDLDGTTTGYTWLDNVARPMLRLYQKRLNKEKFHAEEINQIAAPDWRHAVELWAEWNNW